MISLTHKAPEGPISNRVAGGRGGVLGGPTHIVSGDYTPTFDAEQKSIYGPSRYILNT